MKMNKIYDAQKRLGATVHTTTLESSATYSAMCGNEIYLKHENRQKTGSFKVRGAYNKIASLCESKKVNAVVASSAGNHAQGVAYAAKERNIPAIIVMPAATPIAKISATRGYGAEVVLYGDCYDDAYNKAQEIAREKNADFIHPFNDDDVIAGQATVALEILNQLPDCEQIIVPAGGGGLLAGVAFAVKNINPKIKVYGVQASGADAIVRSYRQKQLVTTEKVSTIADGIAVKIPGEKTVKIINEYVDGMFTVTDEEIASTIIQLIERSKIVVEPAGATPLALALSGRLPTKNAKTTCLLSGGNIDVGFIHKIIEKGLFSRGRQLKLSVHLSDQPGSLEKVAHVMAEANANVISIQYDRMRADLGLNETVLHITCEVSGTEHGKQVITALKNKGFKLVTHS